MNMNEKWLFPGATVPVDVETTAALMAEIKRLIHVVGDMALMKYGPCSTCESLARTVMLDQISHDTQRKPLRDWVGLTDEEIDSITGKIIGWNSACGWEADYARAIEAKLKERNT